MKKRGRPTNASSPRTAKADSTIGRTVHALVFWGFPVRDVCWAVASVARDILQRQDNHKRELSGDRIEQIYEHWKKAQPLKIQRKRYIAKGLRVRCPDKTASVDELALKLLSNGGEWPAMQTARFWSEVHHAWMESPGVIHGDCELTPKAIAEVELARVRLVFPKWGN